MPCDGAHLKEAGHTKPAPPAVQPLAAWDMRCCPARCAVYMPCTQLCKGATSTCWCQAGDESSCDVRRSSLPAHFVLWSETAPNRPKMIMKMSAAMIQIVVATVMSVRISRSSSSRGVVRNQSMYL